MNKKMLKFTDLSIPAKQPNFIEAQMFRPWISYEIDGLTTEYWIYIVVAGFVIKHETKIWK